VAAQGKGELARCFEKGGVENLMTLLICQGIVYLPVAAELLSLKISFAQALQVHHGSLFTVIEPRENIVFGRL
jgi:hypothetical protein